MRKGNFLLLTAVFFSLISYGLFAGGVTEDGKDEGSANEKETHQIVISALKGPSGMAAAKMVKENFQPADNVHADYIILSSPIEAVSKMTSGEIDAAFLPVNTAAKLYTKGIKFRLAAISGLGSLYLVTTDPTLKKIEDLGGKTIFLTGKGATPDYLLRYLLLNNGLEPSKDVSLDFTSTPAQIVQLIAAGKADTAFIPQPFAMLATVKAGAQTAIDPQKELMKLRNTKVAYPFTAFVLSEKFINAEPEAALAVVNALRDSIDWVNNNPSDAAQAIEEMGILSAAIAEPAIPLCAVEFISAEDSKNDVLNFLTMLDEIDPVSIGGKLPDEGFFFK